MPSPLPYLPSNKNLEQLFTKIRSAKIPDKFSLSFMNQTLGVKGSNDRPFIPLLRALGFVDQSGTPTATYRKLKDASESRAAIGQAIRKAYAPLFEANESANSLPLDKLKGLVSQVWNRRRHDRQDRSNLHSFGKAGGLLRCGLRAGRSGADPT